MITPLTILLSLLIGLLVAWAMLAWRAEAGRQAELLAAARPLGLRLDVRDPFELAESYFGLHLFTRGHGRLAFNVLHGRVNLNRWAALLAGGSGATDQAKQSELDLAARLFDYQYETGSGYNRRTHRWQVALIHTNLSWPATLCQPASQHDPLEAIFGLQPVPFDVEPFASRFRVACEDPQFAYRFLHAQVADMLAEHPSVTLEAHGEAIAAYCPGQLGAQQAVRMLALAAEAIMALPGSLREELRQR